LVAWKKYLKASYQNAWTISTVSGSECILLLEGSQFAPLNGVLDPFWFENVELVLIDC
jgi:hypothetical protein